MAYAQINYQQRLGDGVYTIADAGCFLTAFANLLDRFGMPIDPPTLNNYFLQHGTYLPAPEEGSSVRDNLAWGSVASYNNQIVPVAIGGAGWPASNFSIVKFIYKSQRTGQIVNHFCLVADAAAHTIVDSWDGVTKVSPYGEPVASAIYERHMPQVVTPPVPAAQPPYSIENITERVESLKADAHLWDLSQRSWPGMVNNPINSAAAGFQFKTSAIAHHALGGSYYMPDPNQPQGYNIVDCAEVVPPAPEAAPAPVPVPRPIPAPPLTAPSNDPYLVVTKVPGYLTSNQAVNHLNSNSTVAPGTYLIFNKRYDTSTPPKLIAINITQKAGQPGWWINPADNVIAEAPKSPLDLPFSNSDSAPTPPPAAPVDVSSWKTTYRPFVDKYGVRVPQKYQALKVYSVQDLAGQKRSISLPIGWIVWLGGTFVKDDVVYGRPLDAVSRFLWYGIPLDEGIIEPVDKLYDTNTTPQDRQLMGTASLLDYVEIGYESIINMFHKTNK